jgi:serpin B
MDQTPERTATTALHVVNGTTAHHEGRQIMRTHRGFRSRSTVTALVAVALGASLAACGASGTKPIGPPVPSQQLTSGVPQASDVLLVTAERQVRPLASSTVQQRDAANGTAALSTDLLKLLGARNQNLVASPASLATALAMLAPGAHGSTQAQLLRVLHSDLTATQLAAATGALARRNSTLAGTDGNTLRESDTVWTQRGLKLMPAYLDTLDGAFGAGVYQTDFQGNPEAARLAINATVAEQTDNIIKQLFGPDTIQRDTSMVLTDAVYLHASWQQPFDPRDTANDPFHPTTTSSVSVPMMSQHGTFGYAENGGVQAVELPYQGGHLVMDVLLPASGTLDTFRSRLTGAQLTSLLGGLRQSNVDLSLPRFTINTSSALTAPLRQLGLTSLFGPDADLSGIAGQGRSLSVSDIVQQAYVAVGEKGTTAAAATGEVVAGAAAPAPHTVVMTVDHPFVYLIRDPDTGQVFFVGQVFNPTS